MSQLLHKGALGALLALFLVGCNGDRFECAADNPCDFGFTCVAGFCEEVACATSAQCPIEHFCNSSRECVEGCEVDDDCKPGFSCSDEGECVQDACEDTSVDCGYKEFCNSATGECYDAGGDFCRPCEPNGDDCGTDNICWAGYCAVNCDGNRECPSGFQCVPFTDNTGNIIAFQCITYCWLYEGYEPGNFSAVAPNHPGALPLECDDAELLLGYPESSVEGL